jgi:hypothetical protein
MEPWHNHSAKKERKGKHVSPLPKSKKKTYLYKKFKARKNQNTYLALSINSGIPKIQNTTVVVQDIKHADISQTVNLIQLHTKKIKSITHINYRI